MYQKERDLSLVKEYSLQIHLHVVCILPCVALPQFFFKKRIRSHSFF